MLENVLRITYLYNSGFLVETENHVLIFDYCLASTPDPTNQIIENALKRKAFITVFVSHGHSDHFNPLILRWRVKRRDIKYVFSDDIPALDSVISVKSGMEIDLNDIHVTVLPSTDIGVSFLVSVDGFNIYHAGDLNYWNWETEGVATTNYRIQQRKAKIAFQQALFPLNKIKIDVAFFPLDPQTGKYYDTGALYFINNYSPDIFVPMHFRQNYAVCSELKRKLTSCDSQIFCISHKRQVFEYRKGEYIEI